MQSIKYLDAWLTENATDTRFLFTLKNLRALFPHLSENAFRALMSRASSSGLLMRVCRNIYLSRSKMPSNGLLLFHIAALMRANEFNYISLETVLSEYGIISQIPINWISIMSSGRSSIISCGEFGTIEFVHTTRKPKDIMKNLIYDSKCGLWKAEACLALKDIKRTHRSLDLIDWDIANEFI